MPSLQELVNCPVITPNDSGYEATRSGLVFNARKPQRRPAYIVQPQSVADVQACLAYAREAGLRVSIRSGGHNWGGSSLRDGALLLDMSAFNSIQVDPAAMTATIGPGAQNAPLLARLGQHGLCFPAGHCSTVCVGGYLLGGGHGWNAGVWGPACFSVLSIEALTADGELRTLSETENPELFWAARGAGGGFFGVVLSYTVRVYKAPPFMGLSTLIFPASQSGAIGAWLQSIGPALAPGIEKVAMICAAPPPFAAASAQVCMVAAICFADSAEQAEAMTAPLRDCPLESCLHSSFNEAATFDSLFQIMDSSFPPEMRHCADSIWLAAPAGDMFSQAAAALAAAPSPHSSILCVLPGEPPAGSPPPPDMAFSMVGPVGLMCYARWQNEQDDKANLAWLAQLSASLDPHLLGYYIGESWLDASPAHSSRSFGAPQWERLQQLRQKYDPGHLFHWYLGAE